MASVKNVSGRVRKESRVERWKECFVSRLQEESEGKRMIDEKRAKSPAEIEAEYRKNFRTYISRPGAADLK